MKLFISIEGETYEVEVDVDEAALPGSKQEGSARAGRPKLQSSVLRTPAKPGSSLNSDPNEVKFCRSPIAGIVARVTVRPGQKVEIDELLIVLEAMKMESAILSPMGGVLKSVKVTPGEAVMLNQVLVEFE